MTKHSFKGKQGSNTPRMSLAEELTSVYGIDPSSRLHKAELAFAGLISHIEHSFHPVIDIDALNAMLETYTAARDRYEPAGSVLDPLVPSGSSMVVRTIRDKDNMLSALMAYGVPEEQALYLYEKTKEYSFSTGLQMAKREFDHPYFTEALLSRTLRGLVTTLTGLKKFYNAKKELLEQSMGYEPDEVWGSVGYRLRKSNRRYRPATKTLAQRAFYSLYKPFKDGEGNPLNVVSVRFKQAETYTLCNVINLHSIAPCVATEDVEVALAGLVYNKPASEVTKQERTNFVRFLITYLVDRKSMRFTDGGANYAALYTGKHFDGVELTREAGIFIHSFLEFAKFGYKHIYKTLEGRWVQVDMDNYDKGDPNGLHILTSTWTDMFHIATNELLMMGFTPFFVTEDTLYFHVPAEEGYRDTGFNDFQQDIRHAFDVARPEGFLSPYIEITLYDRLPALPFTVDRKLAEHENAEGAGGFPTEGGGEL